MSTRGKSVKNNILMIGNSFCYYYVNELCGIASAAGYDINLCNLYASGCTLNQHWNFYSRNSESYRFFCTTKDGRTETSVKTFRGALDYAKENFGGDWDVISLQQGSYYSLVGPLQSAKDNTLGYADKLYGVIRRHTPTAELYWNQTWAYDIGFGADRINPAERVLTVEKQTEQYQISKALAKTVAEEQNVNIIPSGNAWQIARVKLNGQPLCERFRNCQNVSDYYHDGDVGGGRYLNACVWFEVLFGKSCIGNTWRPDYKLLDAKISALQSSAHEAVAALYGEDYAK